VLGSELHYQALLYHVLRTHGQVPSRQLGMNVKMWITGVVSGYFQKKAKGGGAFEPIPDVVIFGPEIAGDWRRRNFENTLRHVLLAIAMKVSENDGTRPGLKGILGDIRKVAALQAEARYRGRDLIPAVVYVDTAPLERERLTEYGRREAEAAARELGVCFFYVSPGRNRWFFQTFCEPGADFLVSQDRRHLLNQSYGGGPFRVVHPHTLEHLTVQLSLLRS
jgi:hypothetical protein